MEFCSFQPRKVIRFVNQTGFWMRLNQQPIIERRIECIQLLTLFLDSFFE